MKSRHVIWAAVLILMFAAAIAVSQSFHRAHMHGDGMFGEPMMGFHHLNLTDQQRAQMKDIMAKEKPTLSPLMQQVRQTQHQLRQLEMSQTFDEGKVRELASQQAQTMIELTVQRARVHSELFQLLTPEQKTKMNEMMQRQQERFSQRTHATSRAEPIAAPRRNPGLLLS